MLRDHVRTDPFDSRRVSASRVNSLLQCGVAFKYEYVDLIPTEASGSAALFGTVCHGALEKWSVNRSQSLTSLVANEWSVQTDGTELHNFLAEYRPLSVKALALEEEIKAKRPEIKAPRMTRDWKENKLSGQINQLVNDWYSRLQDSPWRFTERDPLPTKFDASISWARKYGPANEKRPNALYTEFSFDVPFGDDFVLTGHIDCIEPHLDTAYLITDYKTYSREPSEFKDYRQLVFYWIAYRDLMDNGFFGDKLNPLLPVYVGCDYVVLGYRRYWKFDFHDTDKLRRELGMYKSIVDSGSFLGAEKNRDPSFCPYPSRCCLTTQDHTVERIDL